MSELNFQKRLLEELVLFFEPLMQGAADPPAAYALLNSLGWNATSLLGPPPNAVITAWIGAATAVNAVEQAVASPPESMDDLVQALGAVKAVVDAVSALPGAVGTGQPPELGTLSTDLIELLALAYLELRAPAAVEVLRVLTIVRAKESGTVVKGTDLVRAPTTVERLDLRRIPTLLSDPITTLRNHYLPGGLATDADATLAAARILPAVAGLLRHAGAHAVIGRGASVPYLDEQTEQVLARTLTTFWPIGAEAVDVELGLTARILSGQEHGPGVLLVSFGAGQIDVPVSAWRLSVSLAGSGGALAIKPGTIEAGAGDVSLEAAVAVGRISAEATPLRIGSTTGTRLEAAALSFGVQGGFKHFSGGTDVIEIGGSTLIQGAKFVVSAGDGDGFLKKILPANGVEIGFDLGVSWSNLKGFHFHGSAGLEATLPIHQTLLGILTVEAITLVLKADSQAAAIAAWAGGSFRLSLGPVEAVVENVGLTARVTFPASGGNLGPLDLAPRFKPPNGIGLSLSTATVSGGGYLSCDPDAGQYFGAAELAIVKQFSLTAVGVLNTKLPGKVDGFSLLLLATLTSETGIQLGFGFVLKGLGGLVGINRTMNVDALEASVQDGRIDSILFPKDVVKNAIKVVSDIQAIFPPLQHQVVLGMMARIAWGTPALIKVDLGLIIELPDPVRIAIMGRLQADLPDEDAALLVLRMNVVGILDFSQRLFAIRADIRDSRLLTFPLSGGMAMRLRWGDGAFFALAVGGFNPRFQPPPGFPALDRMGITLVDEKDIRLGVRSYFALTTNTLQFGAEVYFYAQADTIVGKFSAEANLGFDALVQYSPFYFIVDVHGYAAIFHNDNPILTARLELSVEGPGRWHVWGYAEFHFLLADRRVPVELNFGEQPPQELPPRVSVSELLRDALRNPGSWSAALPAGGGASFRMREVDVERVVVVHPLGQLTVRQRVVPLGVEIERFGEADVEGDRKLALTFYLGEEKQKDPPAPVEDTFARGQYFHSAAEEKLSQPEFERFTCGHTNVGHAGAKFDSAPRSRLCDYEVSIIDDPVKPSVVEPALAQLSAETGVQSGSRQGAAALLATRHGEAKARHAVGVRERRYRALAKDGDGNVTVSEPTSFTGARSARTAVAYGVV